MSHTVTIRSTGERFVVGDDDSILAAALRQNVALPHGCRNGTCGICISQVYAGRIDYPDGPPLALFAEDDSAGKGLCCVGQTRGDLVIEPENLGIEGESWSV
jgi:CDP-4-dehydro-6-deoxyglucose reductase